MNCSFVLSDPKHRPGADLPAFFFTCRCSWRSPSITWCEMHLLYIPFWRRPFWQNRIKSNQIILLVKKLIQVTYVGLFVCTFTRSAVLFIKQQICVLTPCTRCNLYSSPSVQTVSKAFSTSSVHAIVGVSFYLSWS